MRNTWMLGLVAALSACADKTPAPEPPRAPAAEPAVAAEMPPPPIERQRKLAIERPALDGVLAGGPGRFLATIEVKARVKDGNKFDGWEVVRAPWAEVDLVPGDVLLAVNGRTLERPLELESLWTELRTARQLVAEIERAGERFSIEVAIEGEPSAEAAAAAAAAAEKPPARGKAKKKAGKQDDRAPAAE